MCLARSPCEGSVAALDLVGSSYEVLSAPLFWKRKFEPTVIVTCVRWYLRFSLSLRDLEELMAERGLSVDHTSVWRWTQTYGPEVYRRLCGAVRRKSSTWHMDETFVRIAGRWMYLFRAVDSQGEAVDFYLSETRDREAAKIFLKKALAIDGAKQVLPLAGDPHKGFIHVPSRGFALHFSLQSPVDFWTVGLYPSPNGRVIDR